MGKDEKERREEEQMQAFIEAYHRHHGRIMKACEEIGIWYTKYKAWREKYPDFAAAIGTKEEQDELVTAWAESKLQDKIDKGDTTAIIFYLKTKGKNRGYSEKAIPEPKKEAAAASKEMLLAAQRKVEQKKKYIIKLLKKEGKYTAELSMQVKHAAQLMIHAEQLQEEMYSPDYQQVLVEYSREGNRREQINPKEKLYLDLSTQIQRALRALGMNTDSKERKTDGDDLGDFMKDMKLD